jgi:hypothetical protein
MKRQDEIIKSYEDEIEIDDMVLYVHYDITWHCYMDGIGAYEYHGSKGYDTGRFCADILDVEITSIIDFDGNEIQVSDEIKKKLEDRIVEYAEYGDD